ncbi:MAG TPA: hypothetical protein VGH33_02710, partial [Isosphaeraceae bacterium]
MSGFASSLRQSTTGLLCGLVMAWPARAETPPPLSSQLTDLGRQALAVGSERDAERFFRKAVELDPGNVEARRALDGVVKVHRASLRVAQDPDARVRAEPGQATLAEQARLDSVKRQEFSTSVGQRLQRARELTNMGRPEEALSELRTALNAVLSAEQVGEAERRRLENQVRAQIGATEAIEERVALEQAELYRHQAADEARLRALGVVERNQDTIGVLMAEFDNLMAQGTFTVLSNSGTGDIDSTTAPFTDARARAVAARAIDPYVLAPYGAIYQAQ